MRAQQIGGATVDYGKNGIQPNPEPTDEQLQNNGFSTDTIDKYGQFVPEYPNVPSPAQNEWSTWAWSDYHPQPPDDTWSSNGWNGYNTWSSNTGSMPPSTLDNVTSAVSSAADSVASAAQYVFTAQSPPAPTPSLPYAIWNAIQDAAPSGGTIWNAIQDAFTAQSPPAPTDNSAGVTDATDQDTPVQ